MPEDTADARSAAAKKAAATRRRNKDAATVKPPNLDGDPGLDPKGEKARDQADAPGAITPTADDVIPLLVAMPLEELFRVQRHVNQEVGRR